MILQTQASRWLNHRIMCLSRQLETQECQLQLQFRHGRKKPDQSNLHTDTTKSGTSSTRKLWLAIQR